MFGFGFLRRPTSCIHAVERVSALVLQVDALIEGVMTIPCQDQQQ